MNKTISVPSTATDLCQCLSKASKRKRLARYKRNALNFIGTVSVITGLQLPGAWSILAALGALLWAAASFSDRDSKQQPCSCRRQQAELVRAEAKPKALDQAAGMDDMGDCMETDEVNKALEAGRLQALGGGHG